MQAYKPGTLQCPSLVASCTIALLATVIHPYLHTISVVIDVLEHLSRYLGQRGYQHFPQILLLSSLGQQLGMLLSLRFAR